MNDLKYSEILKLNKELDKSFVDSKKYNIAILSNIITSQLTDILEYSLRSQKINSRAISGEYDNIMQDSLKHADSDLVVIFWEAANLIDGLQYKINLMDFDTIDSLVSRVKSEIDFVFASLEKTSLVIFNSFSSLVFNHNYINKNQFDTICDQLNEYLYQNARPNTLFIDINKIFASISIAKSVDFRYYYSSKALYTIEFYKAYVHFIGPIVKSVKGQVKKALIFDCDNTLWKGILGEDGGKNLEMSGKTRSGVVFEEVQHLALSLNRKGVLIGLCSKNNPEDVDEIINNHPDISFREESIAIKKINWNDKAANLREIAVVLNIGLDSLVFVDDSDFEIGLIQESIPEITVLKVPSNLYEYPQLIRSHQQLFYTTSETEEDSKRTDMYKREIVLREKQQTFTNIESYLESLELALTIFINDRNTITRIAQLTQKTNQFNLTTARYTETDVEQFITGGEHIVISFAVNDKYGDSGITGVAILKLEDSRRVAIIDTFLMSCRVIGRNIEFAFFDFLIEYLNSIGVVSVQGSYYGTTKNAQVAYFYDKLGFKCIESSTDKRKYQIAYLDYVFQHKNYIKVNYENEN